MESNMPNPIHYSRIAERYESAARLANRRISEAAGFCAYHAFESIGSAWIRHNRRRIPRRHDDKIEAFVELCRGRNFARRVGRVRLQIRYLRLRNELLYPSVNAQGNCQLPEEKMSQDDAADFIRRIGGVIRTIQRFI